MAESAQAARLREIVERCINGHEPGAIDEYTSSPYVRGSIHAIVGGFADVHVTIDWTMSDGPKAAYYGTLVGTHTGPYMQAAAPTGRRVETGVLVVYEFDDDLQVTDFWLGMNFLAVLDQLGLVQILDRPAS